MDVIVHFTCRDANRIGMESRALQLALMGIKNILALTGDYIGKGFAGQGAPVFDLDSVTLLVMLRMLGKRVRQAGDPDVFFAGCAVSPFKSRRGEVFAQYAKLCRKAAAGAQFAITQLGYDAGQFKELLDVRRRFELDLPILGSVYVLTPVSARIMNAGQVPGAVVSNELLDRVTWEWRDKMQGRALAVERAARLGAVLKGLGYRGIHIAGVQRGFELVGRILDRMGQIEDQWRDFLEDFVSGKSRDGCPEGKEGPVRSEVCSCSAGLSFPDKMHFRVLKAVHDQLFNFDARLAPLLRSIGRRLGRRATGRLLVQLLEDPVKAFLLECRRCGDCAIQHVAFLCPESQCPKHIRNGACGGSSNGCCEVYPERKCVWFRAWERWAESGQSEKMAADCIPPRLWELDGTSSWLNFHLQRDHQSASGEILQACRTAECRIPRDIPL
jgi:methylenetetrahydrofolate reductase (NADPH)